MCSTVTKMRKMAKTLTCAVCFLALFALLSYVTTVHSGEADWPAASLQIVVLDPTGLPVKGATLSVYQENKHAADFQRSFCYSPNWTSNSQGSIELLVKPLRYRVTSYWLFWIIQIRQPCEFEARVSAPGFRTYRMPIRTLLLDSASVQGRRLVDESEFALGFASEQFDILHATITLEPTGPTTLAKPVLCKHVVSQKQ